MHEADVLDAVGSAVQDTRCSVVDFATPAASEGAAYANVRAAPCADADTSVQQEPAREFTSRRETRGTTATTYAATATTVAMQQQHYLFRARRNLRLLRLEGEVADEDLQQMKDLITALELGLPARARKFPGPLVTSTLSNNVAIEWRVGEGRLALILLGDGWWAGHVAGDADRDARGLSLAEAVAWVRDVLVAKLA